VPVTPAESSTRLVLELVRRGLEETFKEIKPLIIDECTARLRKELGRAADDLLSTVRIEAVKNTDTESVTVVIRIPTESLKI